MSKQRAWNGMSIREAKRAVIRSGGRIVDKRRTGEFIAIHPRRRPSSRVNGRRKDAPRSLVIWIRNLPAERE